MRRIHRELKWWGLFALMPLTVALIVLDDDAPLSQTWHLILLGGIAVLICVLAAAWVERNPGLMAREGVDSLTNYRPLLGNRDAASKGQELRSEPISAVIARSVVRGCEARSKAIAWPDERDCFAQTARNDARLPDPRKEEVLQ